MSPAVRTAEIEPDLPVYRDPRRPTEERVADLLGRMTLEEKLAQIGSAWSFQLLTGGELDEAKARELLREGIGQVTRPAGATNLGPAEVAALANGIQRFLAEETRLGIPAIVHEECLHGVLAREAVCYPQAIGQAATWDPPLVGAMARRIAERLRAAGAHQGLAPVLDVSRDPRWGRIEETFGEDPYLVAALGSAYVRGLQGDGPTGGEPIGDEGVVATAKHLVGHGMPEGGMNHAPVHIGPRELRDVYLFPFEAGVREAGVRSVMHAYDEIDGVPCIASRELFTEILRDAWGFDGVAVTDYSGIQELVRSHRLVDGLAPAAALALEAGIDAELPSTAAYGEPLREALEAGLVDLEAVDRAVARVLRTKVELGLFERPYVDATAAGPDHAADRALALELARRSLVLLQNDGILPLPKDLRTVAVIGPNADSARNLLGDYAHVVHIESLLEMRDGPNPFGFPIPTDLGEVEDLGGRATIRTAIASLVSDSTDVRYALGCGILDGDEAGIAEAVEAARGADVAILVVGERSGLTNDCTCGESRDRLELSLAGRQEELVAAVTATGTPIVLVVVSGRPLALGAAADRAAAVLFAWVPGEEGPNAVAEALFGDVNPGGKLPVTMPRHVGQVPIHYAHKPTGGRSHWKQEYVDGSHRPLWPFGHGLSYTSFALRDLELDRPDLPTHGELAVAVEVENTGDRGGDEVVQLYVRDEEASVTRPVKELRGFARVLLALGERRRIVFRLAAEQLAFTDLRGDLVVEPGWIELMVGTSSEDLPCLARVELVGERRRIERRTRYLTAVELGSA